MSKQECSTSPSPQGGVYSCQADNGFGPQPVSKVVKLEIHCESSQKPTAALFTLRCTSTSHHKTHQINYIVGAEGGLHMIVTVFTHNTDLAPLASPSFLLTVPV